MIWSSLNYNFIFSILRTIFVVILVLFISIVVATPSLFIGIGLKSIEHVDLTTVSGGFLTKTTLSTHMITAMTVLCNLIILPSVIEYTTLLEHFST